MPSFEVATPRRNYPAVVERGIVARVRDYVPERSHRNFVVTTEHVWSFQGARLSEGLRGLPYEILLLPGGEEQKRLAPIEALAEEMVRRGADRSSTVIAFGGGIVTDMAGFLAAVFMRGIDVLQIPTTLLAQVDAAIGGKTGANLVGGKNLIGSFHQPLAVLIDPALVETLSDREYRAGLYEVIKYGVIASEELFDKLRDRRDEVLARSPGIVDAIISESVRIKAEVVSADERESGLRRILNFGHTIGHALEAETKYSRFLHGEAIAFGMRAAATLAYLVGRCGVDTRDAISHLLDSYGAIPDLGGVGAAALQDRLMSDKKTLRGKIHFVLPEKIGRVIVTADIPGEKIRQAIEESLA